VVDSRRAVTSTFRLRRAIVRSQIDGNPPKNHGSNKAVGGTLAGYDANSFLSDASFTPGDAQDTLTGANTLQGDAKLFLDDATFTLSDAKNILTGANTFLGGASFFRDDATFTWGDARDALTDASPSSGDANFPGSNASTVGPRSTTCLVHGPRTSAPGQPAFADRHPVNRQPACGRQAVHC